MSQFDVKTFTVNPLQENCYIVCDESKECVIIDCGAFFQEERDAVIYYIRDKKLKPIHLLCTHAHFDHVFGADTIYQHFGLKPKMHQHDEFLYNATNEQTLAVMGIATNLQVPPCGTFLNDGDIICFGNHKLKVLHVPGHSPGSVLFYCEKEKVVFSGDTLFRMSVGRTDLQRGSWTELMNSMENVVAKLPADTIVYTGHGPKTIIGEELQMNPYLK
ncbi:MBL fold metallo-hydrolase [Prevotella sp. E13-17]|uniref:MBL fold metallo-hydrolase n=1 Tax=Prevotella sp. E13-17 TaxID=2913616 RepID=UPI001EDC680D|nr:MBL fold metallo-hydrolase [Prevotella sp. E13-17]UKK49908.1 MBL fold metallo-hydrolase [Prevotella sp. E13-17]